MNRNCPQCNKIIIYSKEISFRRACINNKLCSSCCRKIPEKNRFWSYVKKTPECWIWDGNLSSTGYGRININKKMIAAHRFSYGLHYGIIPKDKLICHRCDNPKCVNPKHLFLGTSRDNVHDMINKKRDNFHGGISFENEKNPNSKLTKNDVIFIKQSSLSQRKLAKQFNVSRSCIVFIKRGLSWKNI